MWKDFSFPANASSSDFVALIKVFFSIWRTCGFAFGHYSANIGKKYIVLHNVVKLDERRTTLTSFIHFLARYFVYLTESHCLQLIKKLPGSEDERRRALQNEQESSKILERNSNCNARLCYFVLKVDKKKNRISKKNWKRIPLF